MRIGVVADATCDLPSEFIKTHDIGILPVTIQLGVELLESMMSATSAVSIGAGCVSIAYAGQLRPLGE